MVKPSIEELFSRVAHEGGSDLHICVGVEPCIRKNGKIVRIGKGVMLPDDTKRIVQGLLKEKDIEKLNKSGQVDFSYSIRGVGRYRVNVFKQRGTYSLVARHVKSDIPEFEKLGLPESVLEFANQTGGLILVTGPTGSGKSTTLASLVDRINRTRQGHILTLEDPIEYLHPHKECIVNQREVGSDVGSYAMALKAALREDPDVILVGEMRDMETISIAVTAAETGHLVLSTLHTQGAASTVDRIIDVFPPDQQQQIRTQLAKVLRVVVSQKILTRTDNSGAVLAAEIMIVNSAIENLIREGKVFQIDSVIQTGANFGMKPFDTSLVELYKKDLISYEQLLNNAHNKENIVSQIKGL